MNRVYTALAVALLLGCGGARADFVNFSYAWSVMPAPVIPSGTGNVTFSVESGASAAEVAGGQPAFIPAATFQTSSLSDGGDEYNADFGLALRLKEGDKSGELTFKGTLAGTLTPSSSSVTVAFHGPLTQTLRLGGHDYAVTVGPTSVDVPSPADPFTARIDAAVRVTAAQSPPPPHSTPEPSALVLAGLALAAVGVACRQAGASDDDLDAPAA